MDSCNQPNRAQQVGTALGSSLKEVVGKLAYDAYCLKAGGKTFDGKPCPMWDELGDDRQGCWNTAGQAVSLVVMKAVGEALRRGLR